MALLTAAEVKQLVPKSREVGTTSLQVYLDAAEKRIVSATCGARRAVMPSPGMSRPMAGAGNSGSAGRRRRIRRNGRRLVLGQRGRPDAENVTSITRIAETPETIAASSWFVLRPNTLYRGGCWPEGLIRVVYNAVEKEAEAKEAQAHLVAIALIADGIASIEDGEFVERRLQGVGSESDMIARAERRILGKLLSGADMV